jgi:predicted transcriptional regulator
MSPRSSLSQKLLSPYEWRVFWIVSNRHPLTIAEISRELVRIEPEKPPPNDNTVRTFVARLFKKGYLTRAKGQEAYAYEPCVPYDAALRFHATDFLHRFALGGRRDIEAVCEVASQRLEAI